MTVQEAIEAIERLGVDSRGYPKLKEALSMAIEALKEQAKLKGTVALLEVLLVESLKQWED